MSQTWKPPIPPVEKVTRLTAYAKPSGWAVVTAFIKEECEVYPRRYYIPIQRKPQGYELETHKYRQWKSREHVEPWLKSVGEYVDDVAAILEFATSKTVEKLMEFNVVVNADENGLVKSIGLDLGDKVVSLGPPPELVYVAVEQELGGGWAVPAHGEYIRTLVYTAMWREAVRVAGCEVRYLPGGLAKVICGGGELVTERAVLPLDDIQEEGFRITDKMIDALLDGP